MFKVNFLSKMMLSAMICGVILSSCGGGGGSSSSSSPKTVADKALSAMVKVDAKAFVGYLVQADHDADEVKKGTMMVQALLEAMPLAKYEIKGETIDGDKAEVDAVLFFKDGSTKNAEIPFVKTEKGWKISDLSW